MALRIHNSLTRQLETFKPIQPGKVGMYVCGMTVYDRCHMGHARMMMAFDVVVRWLRASGYDVTYVRNITDIDDKIITRAAERGTSLRALTDEMIGAMHRDLGALGVLTPTHEPRATDHVQGMLDMIGILERKGLAYRAAGGDVNFAVRKQPGYGKLSGKSLDQLRAGERVAVSDGKDDPLDFVLWKAAKADEPKDATYDSPYGPGRPGWHIECSAMSRALLGDRFDIHGGGMDLMFPHHENEIAQSEGVLGHPFVNVWMHNGFLNVDNTKMSKSLGNFFTIQDVLKKFDGETLRVYMMRTHYRSPFNYSDAGLEDARAALRRLYTALDAVSAQALPDVPVDWQQPRCRAFKEAMDEDFNTPLALAAMFELAADMNRAEAGGAEKLSLGRQLRALGATLGVLQQSPRAFLQSGGKVGATEADVHEIEAAIAERALAKREKRFADADRIRDTWLARGVIFKDSPTGTTWVKS